MERLACRGITLIRGWRRELPPLAILLVVALLGWPGVGQAQRYDQGARFSLAPALTSVMLRGEVKLQLPWGVSGAQRPGAVPEAAPLAFRPLADGSCWLARAGALRRYGSDGREIARIPLDRSPARGAPVTLFALAASDTFWVYRPAAGLLERLDGRGEVVAEVEGLRDLLALGPCRDGGVLAVAPRTGKVLRFSGAGVLVGDYPDPGSLAAVADPLGHPYGLAVSPRALELQRSQPGQVPQTLARIDLDASIPANARVTLATILGADRVGNIYLLVEAADDEPVIHAHRLLKVAATGRVLASREAEPLGFSPECPPCYAIGPEGDIYSYRCAGGSWSLIGWRLP